MTLFPFRTQPRVFNVLEKAHHEQSTTRGLMKPTQPAGVSSVSEFTCSLHRLTASHVFSPIYIAACAYGIHLVLHVTVFLLLPNITLGAAMKFSRLYYLLNSFPGSTRCVIIYLLKQKILHPLGLRATILKKNPIHLNNTNES